MVTSGTPNDKSDIAWLVVRHLIQEADEYWTNNGQAPDDCRNAYLLKTATKSGQQIVQAETVGAKVMLKVHQWKLKLFKKLDDPAWNDVEDIYENRWKSCRA